MAAAAPWPHPIARLVPLHVTLGVGLRTLRPPLSGRCLVTLDLAAGIELIVIGIDAEFGSAVKTVSHLFHQCLLRFSLLSVHRGADKVAASVVERGGAVAAAGEPAVAVAEARAVPSRERLAGERTGAIAERAGRERQLRCGMLRAPVIIASVSSVGRIIFIGCVTSRSFQRLASPKSTINCRSSGVEVFQIVHISSRSARPTAARVVALGFPQIATAKVLRRPRLPFPICSGPPLASTSVCPFL
jgi:hypothetical protein